MTSSPTPMTLAVEGDLDEVVLTRLVRRQGGEIGSVYGLRGKDYLRQKLRGYNNAANFAPWIVLMDLNGDAPCAPSFLAGALNSPSSGMRLRIAVRSVESWLMADREHFAKFLGVNLQDVPEHPELESNPKARVLDLARRSRRGTIRTDLLPRRGSTARVGPLYNLRLSEYASSTHRGWRPQVAAKRSESLRRCLGAIDSLLTWHPRSVRS